MEAEHRVLGTRHFVLVQPRAVPPRLAAGNARRGTDAAGDRLAAIDLRVGRVSRPDGPAESLCRLQLFDVHLGELQGVRRDRVDARVLDRPGRLPEPLYQARGGRIEAAEGAVVSTAMAVSAQDIRDALQAALAPTLLDVQDDSHLHA